MTSLLIHPPVASRPVTDGPFPAAPAGEGLRARLDAMAEEAAAVDGRPRIALAARVEELERAAGAWLGPAIGDPLVVLQRRFARAHRLLMLGPG